MTVISCKTLKVKPALKKSELMKQEKKNARKKSR